MAKSAMGSGESGTRTRQPSRKGKKAWRRNIDGSAVENAIARNSEAQRLGLHEISKASDDALFVFDCTGGLAAAPRSGRKCSVRILDILDAHHGIVRPVLGRQRSAAADARRSLEAKKRGLSEGEHAIVRKKAKALRSALAAAERNPTSSPYSVDLWAETTATEAAQQAETLGVSINGRALPSRPTRPNEPLAKRWMPAVTPAPLGASYNPPVEAHQQLLAQANRIAKISEKAIERAEQAHKACYVVCAGAPATNADLANAVEDADEPAVSLEPRAPPKPSKRLSRAERNRLERKKKLRLQIEAQIQSKIQMKDALIAADLVDEIQANAVKQEARLEARRKRRTGKLRRLRLSKYIQEGAEPTISCLPKNRLPGSLRAVSQVGNLLEERFRTFQARNMIETRMRTAIVRKYALRPYVKRSYKDFDATYDLPGVDV